MAVALFVLTACVCMLPASRALAAATCVDLPERFSGLVEYACFRNEGPDVGVSLKMTVEGLTYCRGVVGPYRLAAWLMAQDGWRGGRSLRNVVLEIRGHCWAALFPGLADRANPIDIEFYQSWPLNLFLRAAGPPA